MKAKPVVSADIVVIGAGVAGLSTAYHLAKNSSLRVLVLEQETVLGGHASGRNAGMIRQAVSDPALAKLAVLGRNALLKASRTGWKGLSFAANGSLFLAKKNKISELKKIRSVIARLGVSSSLLSREETSAKVPALAGGDFEQALFCPSDALVEIGPLLAGFRRELWRLRVPVLFGATPRRILKNKNGFTIDLGGKTIATKKIVNAAGAWCALLAEKIGAQKIPLTPYRRHLYQTYPLRLGQQSWPFVWDLSHDFYFRPEEGGLLLSPCDKAAVDRKFLGQRVEKTDAGVEKILLQKLRRFSKNKMVLRIKGRRSGLRTMTPDGRFVIGEDQSLPGFYWVAGLGGHGVTTCFSVGKLSSDIILGRKTDGFLTRAFSPRRFKASR